MTQNNYYRDKYIMTQNNYYRDKYIMTQNNDYRDKYIMTQNNYYKEIFSQYAGYVYEYQGQTQGISEVQKYLVDQFVTETGKQNLAVSVTQLPKNSRYLLHSFELISSENFILMADLSYQAPLQELDPQDPIISVVQEGEEE